MLWGPNGTGKTSIARLLIDAIGGAGATVEVPTGCSIFPKEIVATPRSWAEQRYPNIVYWNELDKGGHFAA